MSSVSPTSPSQSTLVPYHKITEGEKKEWNEFLYSISSEKTEKVAEILKAKPHWINAGDGVVTPLIKALLDCRSVDMPRLLINANADVTHRPLPQDATPLYYAIVRSHIMRELIPILSTEQALKTKDIHVGTPLTQAAKSSDYETCELLLQRGAVPSCGEDNYADKLIFRAIENNKLSLLKLLVRHKQLLSLEYCGSTPLQVAAKAANTEACKILFQAGAKASEMFDETSNLVVLENANQPKYNDVIFQLRLYSAIERGIVTLDMFRTIMPKSDKPIEESKADKKDQTQPPEPDG